MITPEQWDNTNITHQKHTYLYERTVNALFYQKNQNKRSLCQEWR